MNIFEKYIFINEFYTEKPKYLNGSSLIGWNPFTGFSEGLFSFGVDFILTFSGHPSGFSIGHTKYIISLDSPVDSTVTWDWLSIL